MQTVNVEDLPADVAAQVENWLGNGEGVELRRGGREFARVVRVTPPTTENGAPPAPPVDWAAQRKAIWGDRVFSTEEVRRASEAELGGEEG